MIIIFTIITFLFYNILEIRKGDLLMNMNQDRFLRRLLCAVLICALSIGLGAPSALAADGSVKIDAAHFPDTAFRELVADTYDEDADGVLSAEEIKDATEFYMTRVATLEGEPTMFANIKSIEGIQYLVNLEEVALEGSQITSLSALKLPNLKSLDVTKCQKLTLFNPGSCPKLEGVYISDSALSGTIDFSSFKALKYLDVTGNSGLTGLKLTGLSNLAILHCGECSLKELTLSGLPDLHLLECYGNKIQALDLRSCPYLAACDQNNNDYMEHKTGTTIYGGQSTPTGGMCFLYVDDKTKLIRSKADATIADATVKAGNKNYTGKALKPAVTVTWYGKKLNQGTDYTVSYKNNKAIGIGTVTVTGKGNYSGKKSAKFKIYPAKAKLSSVKNTAARTVTVTWKKAKSGTGYQCQYATKSSFKSAKKITVKKLKTTKKEIKKLKKGKTYYVRVRNYKKVGKKVYYGPWSTVKKVKITR